MLAPAATDRDQRQAFPDASFLCVTARRRKRIDWLSRSQGDYRGHARFVAIVLACQSPVLRNEFPKGASATGESLVPTRREPAVGRRPVVAARGQGFARRGEGVDQGRVAPLRRALRPRPPRRRARRPARASAPRRARRRGADRAFGSPLKPTREFHRLWLPQRHGNTYEYGGSRRSRAPPPCRRLRINERRTTAEAANHLKS